MPILGNQRRAKSGCCQEACEKVEGDAPVRGNNHLRVPRGRDAKGYGNNVGAKPSVSFLRKMVRIAHALNFAANAGRTKATKDENGTRGKHKRFR